MIRSRAVARALALFGAAVLAGCGGGGPGDPPTAQAANEASPPAHESALAASPALRRVTTYGPVLGAADAPSGTYAWRGLPYAQPPTGALRWMPPVEPQAWTETRPAQAYGPSCAQTGRFFSPAPGNAPFGLSVRDGFDKPVGAEDCLTLNVWRPAAEAGPLPVIVFLHGGSNISGYSADPIYEGSTLAARARAVVVTVNYRLGLFGWLDMGPLKTGDAVADSGNFATLDHLAALRWVRANIAAFGGDPGNVTLMGESAGAVDTWALLVSPLARGLFHKAVAMSGGLQTADAITPKAYAGALLKALLIADGKASNDVTAGLYVLSQGRQRVAAYLRSKTMQELIQAEQAAGLSGRSPAVFADGVVLPLNPLGAILSGQYNRVPMLAGNTKEEGKLFGGLVGAYQPNDYDRFTLQYHFDPDAAPTLAERDLLTPRFLPVDQPFTGWNTVSALLGTTVFTTGTIESMSALSWQQPTQTWYYRFDWNEEPAPFNTVYGASHAMDLPFAFGNFGRSALSFAFSTANRPGRLALSDAMMRSLGAFAATGHPQHAGLGSPWPNWPAKMVFDASATQARIGVAW